MLATVMMKLMEAGIVQVVEHLEHLICFIEDQQLEVMSCQGSLDYPYLHLAMRPHDDLLSDLGLAVPKGNTFLGEVYIQDTCGTEDNVHHESYATQA